MHIDLGAMAPALGEQIPDLPEKDAVALEAFRLAINLLRIHSLLSPEQARDAERKLVERISGVLRVAAAIREGETP